MIMLKKTLFIAVLFISMTSVAQKPVYRSYNYGALLTGSSSNDGFQVLTTHGIELGSYFVGLGAGMDSYRKFSYPLFLTGSKYLFPLKNNLFLNVNGGTSFVSNNETTMQWSSTPTSFVPRFFGEAGLGYRFDINSRKTGQGILFGAFYSYKAVREKFTLPGSCPNPPCADVYEYIDYKLNRWAFKMGFAL